MADAPIQPANLSPRLLSLTSHELRTPISVVAGYLRMLVRDREQFGERHRKMIEEAEKACTRMVALIGEISTVGRLEAGDAALKKETLDLFGLIREVVAAEDQASGPVRLAVQHTGADNRPGQLVGDRTLLKESFASLIRAVVREQADERVIIVGIGRRDTQALITIARDDAAATIAGEAVAPFDEYRGGMGLALPIARRILEQHGGIVRSPAGADGAALPRSGIVVELPLAPA